MSIGSDVTIVFLQLQALLQEIRQETLNVMAVGKVPNPEDANYFAYFHKLDNWKSRLIGFKQWIEKMSSNIQSQRNYEHPSLRGVPSEMKRSLVYRHHQSLDDKSKNVEHAEKVARQVADALNSLLIRSIIPSPAEQENAIARLLKYEDLVDQMQSHQVMIFEAEHLHSLETGLAGQLRATIKQEQTQYLSVPKALSPLPDLLGMTVFSLTLLRIWWLNQIGKNFQKKK
jgi:hypothetical protein